MIVLQRCVVDEKKIKKRGIISQKLASFYGFSTILYLLEDLRGFTIQTPAVEIRPLTHRYFVFRIVH
jgi:hypothetical protein